MIDPVTGEWVEEVVSEGNIDPNTGEWKSPPSVAEMAAPSTSKYVSKAMETEGGTMTAPQKEPGQSDEAHKAAVEAWQANNRKNLQEAAHAVVGDVTSLIPRVTGTAVGTILQKVPGAKEFITGEENPTAPEMMANPETSVMRPVIRSGQEDLQNGNTFKGLGKVVVGSVLENPSSVAGAAKSALTMGFKKVTPAIIKTGAKDIADNIDAKIADMPVELKTKVASLSKSDLKKLGNYAIDESSKYKDVVKLPEHLREAATAYKKAVSGNLEDIARWGEKNGFDGIKLKDNIYNLIKKGYNVKDFITNPMRLQLYNTGSRVFDKSVLDPNSNKDTTQMDSSFSE